MSSADKITKFHQFHRGAGNSRRGVIAAEYNHTTQSFKIAHSLCNLNDNLDPRVGVMIAKGRLHDMEWIPMNRIHDGFVTASIPWTMDATTSMIRNRLVRTHNKNISATQYPDTDGVLRVKDDGPTEAQIDQIIVQGDADARRALSDDAVAAAVCRGHCGCHGG